MHGVVPYLADSGAHGSVDALAQEVRMPVVAAVLQEHVHHHHPQGYLLAPPGLVSGQVQGLGLPLDAARVLHLGFPGRERLVPGRRAGVVCRLEVDLVRPDHGRVVVLEYAAEPRTLDLRHVPHQTEQGRRRGRHRLLPRLLVRESFTFHGKGREMVIEESSQLLAFGAEDALSLSYVDRYTSN